MVFVDPFFLTMTLIFVFILIFANIYFLAHYAHHADAFFGSSTAVKAVLVSFMPSSPFFTKISKLRTFSPFFNFKAIFWPIFLPKKLAIFQSKSDL